MSYCKTKPGILIPSDVPRIAERLVELKRIAEPNEVGTFLRATRAVEIFDKDTQRTTSLGLIGPARNRRGRCIFLTADNRCEIHDVSPFGCAYFDAHMDPKEIERRKMWSMQQLRQSVSYADLRRTLAPAEGGTNAPRS